LPKFSIILPVHNGGEYIKKCIESVLSQTYSDFTLHILDNYSTDGTTEWLHTLKDLRIKLIPSSTLLPIEQNWERIKNIEKNDFITLIGHDDLLNANYLSVMNNLINQHPAASLYQTHFNYIDSKGNEIRKCKPMSEVQSAAEFLSYFLSNKIDVMGTGFMMRAVDYDSAGGIPSYPNLLFADFELWIKIAQKSYKATAKETCFSFRLHQSMTTKSADIKFQKAFEQFLDFLIILKTDAELKSVIEKDALVFIKQYCRGLSHRLLRTPYNKRNSVTVKDFIQLCKNYADQLVPGNDFNPGKQFSLRLAAIIDNNLVTRNLFLFFKRIYSKPIFK
jgi:glycosyltransferase involved in cell wall biosynthesis